MGITEIGDGISWHNQSRPMDLQTIWGGRRRPDLGEDSGDEYTDDTSHPLDSDRGEWESDSDGSNITRKPKPHHTLVSTPLHQSPKMSQKNW